MPVTLLVLLIYGLAVTRLTGIITQDTITEPIRERIVARLDNRPHTLGQTITTLLNCPWCAGMWVCIVATPLVWWWATSPWLLAPALALAFAQFVGMTSQIGR
jgi:hypothetical protein